MTAPASGSGPGWTLLAVDGDPNILAGLRHAIRPMGWRILTAGRAEEAMAMLAIHPVDAVLCDLLGPRREGLALLERVSRGWPGAARVLLIDRPDPSLLLDAINHGRLHGCIVKPWDEDELMSMLRRITRRRRIEAAGLVVEPCGAGLPPGSRLATTVGRVDEFDVTTVDARAGGLPTAPHTRQMSTLYLRTSDLRSGQTLAQNFESPKGALLLSAGHRLSEDLIHRIRAFEREHNLSLTLVVQSVQ